MSTTSTAKRPLDNSNSSSKRASSPDGMDSDSGGGAGDGSEQNSNPASKRRERKPGRKPLETEAKDKRTAQNRAAQRAFRERRERKMKELEEKVSHLESLNKQSELETKFLRNQVTNLLSELKRYNPELPKKRDSLLLEYLAKQRKNSADGSSDFSLATNNTAAASVGGNGNGNGNSNGNSNGNGISTATPLSGRGAQDFQFDFPWKLDSAKIPSPSSDSTSPSILDTTKNESFGSSTNLQQSGSSVSTYSSSSPSGSRKHSNTLNLYHNQPTVSSEFDFDSQFDESVSSFCSKLSMACGTRTNPIPRASSLSNTSPTELLRTKVPETKQPANTNLSNINDNDYPNVHVQVNDPFPVVLEEDNANNTNTHNTNGNTITAASIDTPHSKKSPTNDVDNGSSVSSWHQPSFGQLGFRTDQLFDLDFDNASSVTKGKTANNNYTTATNSPGKSDNMNWNLNAPLSKMVSRNMMNPDLPFIDSALAFPDYDDPLLDILKAENESEQQKEENDPIQALINEEPSMPLSHNTAADSSIPSNTVQQSGSDVVNENEELIQDIIPSNDGKLPKCSEVWDRITAHPRYSDLDIDGLCLELRTKAKCSEKGVVVNAEDVQTALLKHMQ